jgi:hypothetical protein
MESNHLHNDSSERRSEERSLSQRYYSVQFKTTGLASFYQFKLWNISAKGLCILVKEGSEVLNHLEVGNTIEMTYYLANDQGGQENFRTQIKHITKSEDGRFEGHFLVGLSIL